MDRTVVKVGKISEQSEAFCLHLTPNERLRVLEDLNRQGRILMGLNAQMPLNRKHCVML